VSWPAVGRRWQQVLLLAAVTGLITGGSIALFEEVTNGVLLNQVVTGPLWLQVTGPLIGLLLAAASLRWLGHRATPSTSDEYIRNFHDRGRRLPLRPVPARILASVATLGLGGPLGYEGPSLYLGAAIGSGLQRRLTRFFSRDDAKVLLVAGAAAGVAAIFKAPATGAVFALEVPYQDDLARRMLLPALIGAAVSYITYASLQSTAPLLPVRGAPPFDLVDLGGAVVVGLLAGVGARAFAWSLRRAKATTEQGRVVLRAVVAGAALGLLALGSHIVVDQPLTLGPGYHAIQWAIDPAHSVGLVALLLVARAVAVDVAIMGGGAGGLFVPLVVEGALLGRICGSLFGQPGSSLFPVIGIAAFLGAGYRVPLAAVMFVAESTGRPGFVVPGLVAAVVAQLVMGRSSVSGYQQAARGGHLERRFSIPLAHTVQTDVRTIPPDATIADFFWHHLIGNREKSAPVVDGSRYVGMIRLDEIDSVPRDEWEVTKVVRIMRTDMPVARITWTLRQALVAMEEADVDRMPVVQDDGAFVGMVSTADLLNLDEIIEQTEEGGSPES
jgi:CIC family chloride channel protein